MKPTIFAYVDGICMILLALFNFYLLFRYPSFEEYQRRKHYYVRTTALREYARATETYFGYL
jgi:hypothetical protein